MRKKQRFNAQFKGKLYVSGICVNLHGINTATKATENYMKTMPYPTNCVTLISPFKDGLNTKQKQKTLCLVALQMPLKRFHAESNAIKLSRISLFLHIWKTVTTNMQTVRKFVGCIIQATNSFFMDTVFNSQSDL